MVWHGWNSRYRYTLRRVVCSNFGGVRYFVPSIPSPRVTEPIVQWYRVIAGGKVAGT